MQLHMEEWTNQAGSSNCWAWRLKYKKLLGESEEYFHVAGPLGTSVGWVGAAGWDHAVRVDFVS